MTKRYKYLPINGGFYCLNQNPLSFLWFLFFKKWSFHHFLGLKKKKGIKTVINLVLYQLHLRNNSKTLEMPKYGNLCLQVHRGYKVFDFHKKAVIKIIDPEIDSEIVMREIESVRKVSPLSFAPSILGWDIEEGWYKEDLVIGHPFYSAIKSRSDVFLNIFNEHIALCLEQMILLQASVRTNLSEHIKKTINIIDDNKLLKEELDSNKTRYIKRYVKTVAEQLCNEGDCQIDLIFSHGDYSLVNILKTKGGIMVIDWEGGGLRTPLFDLYNYFLTELYYERATSTSGLVLEINKAISMLKARLLTKVPELAGTMISLAPIYRRLYYLERICMLLERELNNKSLSVIVRSIDVFNRYEETTASYNHS